MSNKKPIIVSFGHRSKMGKNTAANFLADSLANLQPIARIRCAGFADKVKDISYLVYGWAGLQPKEYYEINRPARYEKLGRIGKSPLEIWIAVGNSLRDNVHPDTWANYLLHDMSGSCEYLLIYDLRFGNEMKAITDRGGMCIKIHRDEVAYIDSPSDQALEHLEDYDWDEVWSNLTEAEVKDKCRKLAERLVFGE